MIFKPVRIALSLFVGFAVAWFVFMVPLGRYTLFEHMRAIAATDEARELGDAMGEAGDELRGQVVRQIGDAIPRPDGGALSR